MRKVICMLGLMLALNACQSKDSYMKDFRGFVNEVELEAAGYSDKDWEKADQRFTDLSTKEYVRFEENLTPDEKAEIVKLQAAYSAVKMKAGVKGAAKKVDKLLEGIREGTK